MTLLWQFVKSWWLKIMSLVKAFMAFFMNHGEIQSDRGGDVEKYEICGTCSIKRHENQTIIQIAPTVGYISRDKSRAILYPCEHTTTNNAAKNVDETAVVKIEEMALLIAIQQKMDCRYIEIPLHTKDFILNQTLIKAADSMKLIQIQVEKYPGGLQITGCLFPAP